MRLEVHTKNGIVILRPKGMFIGGKETDLLNSKIGELSDADNRKLIINISKVTYTTMAAIGVLIQAHLSYAKRGAQMRLCGVGDRIHQVFVMTKMILVLGYDYRQTEEEAVAGFTEIPDALSSVRNCMGDAFQMEKGRPGTRAESSGPGLPEITVERSGS